ncbi:hypothetical protein GCM10025866_16660 [Naasia aerilata]|uniref:Uncharacterized protein n=1 Tax=Naasia aerilata TaxID=1162966 RepID=A0ABN6XLB7_9MICO|nr:hypothetical protein GCM10025866_16660 [Naasia aerilata]
MGISAIAGVLATVAVTPAIALTGLAANNSIGMFENLPGYLKIGDLPERTTIYAHRAVDGADTNTPIASFFAENRESVAWDQVSQFAKDAAIAAEDPATTSTAASTRSASRARRFPTCSAATCRARPRSPSST